MVILSSVSKVKGISSLQIIEDAYKEANRAYAPSFLLGNTSEMCETVNKEILRELEKIKAEEPFGRYNRYVMLYAREERDLQSVSQSYSDQIVLRAQAY
jgi:hypothetical protein